MAILITGVAGFIGSNLAKALLAEGHSVIGYDNLSLGKMVNLQAVLEHKNFSFVKTDVADLTSLQQNFLKSHELNPITEVWHLAANSDIPSGIANIAVDLRNTFTTTVNIIQLMQQLAIPKLFFASSSAIYGDHGNNLLVEDKGPYLPISNYGAMKLASEAVISAAVESNIKQAYIFRFPNVIGVPATHGVLLDFMHKLTATPDRLEVLGNGTQQKGYLHVNELINAMLFIRDNAHERINLFNIGAPDDGATVAFIAESVVAAVAPHAQIIYGTADRGWVGDVPRFYYSIEKLLNLGWQPRLDSKQAIALAIHEILEYGS